MNSHLLPFLYEGSSCHLLVTPELIRLGTVSCAVGNFVQNLDLYFLACVPDIYTAHAYPIPSISILYAYRLEEQLQALKQEMSLLPKKEDITRSGQRDRYSEMNMQSCGGYRYSVAHSEAWLLDWE